MAREFLRAGQAVLKTRAPDARDLEIARLQQKLGEIIMDNELFQKKIGHLKDGCPLVRSTASGCRLLKAKPAGAAIRTGPGGPCSDQDLLPRIQTLLAETPFHGGDYRKVWVRLPSAGLRPSRRRVLRLMSAFPVSKNCGPLHRPSRLIIAAAVIFLPRFSGSQCSLPQF
jgi:hypothetical protein|uniref:Uncharacterized protein n=1 Tax=Desulfobacca acetoxidans TaxID=60893 RepID=A0A7V6A2H3_9BACT